MRALVYLGPGTVTLQERPIPALTAPDDVLVQVVGSGVCGTDRKILLGHFPARSGVILGHESVGVVAGRGRAVRSLADGDRVVVDPTLYCGGCDRCRRGATNFCRRKQGTEVGVDRDGTFADYVLLPERFVHRLPETIGFRPAVLIEPLACVLNNVSAAGVTCDDVVAVLGAGPIGTLCGLVSGRIARRVVMVETDPYRLAAAQKRFFHVVDAVDAKSAKAVVDTAGGQQPSVVIDTTGVGLDDAVTLVADGGRVVMMGFNSTYRISLSPLYLTHHGISLLGAGDYRADVFPVAVALAPELELTNLVTHEYPLERYADAFGALGGVLSTDNAPTAYGAMKVVIRSELGELGMDGWP